MQSSLLLLPSAASRSGTQQRRPARRVSLVASAAAADQPQAAFAPGASVHDNSKHGNSRGYGVIERAAEEAHDGTPKWYVRWDDAPAGSRCTAISETYLELSHIPHHYRKAPKALQQSVVVMYGTYKGKKGKTEKKVGWLHGPG